MFTNATGAVILQYIHVLNQYNVYLKYITHSICEYPGHIVDLKLYECDYISGDFKLNIHSDYKWVGIEELLDYDLADADVILSKFLIKKYIEDAKENNK